MDIEKEFYKWFNSSELKKVFTSPGQIAGLKLAFEIGADKIFEDIVVNLFKEHNVKIRMVE